MPVMQGEPHVRAGYETAAGHAPLFAMPPTVPCKIIASSSPTHGLQRRLLVARFLRLHRATLRRDSLLRLICVFDTRGLPTGSRWVQWAVTRAF